MFWSFKRTNHFFHLLHQKFIIFWFPLFIHTTILCYSSRIGLKTRNIVIYLRNKCIRHILALWCFLILNDLIIYWYLVILFLVLKIIGIVFGSSKVKWLFLITPSFQLLFISHSTLKLLSVTSKWHRLLIIF